MKLTKVLVSWRGNEIVPPHASLVHYLSGLITCVLSPHSIFV